MTVITVGDRVLRARLSGGLGEESLEVTGTAGVNPPAAQVPCEGQWMTPRRVSALTAFAQRPFQLVA